METKADIKAVIGLGNPGSKYHHTRHNIGFRVLDALAEKFNGSWQDSDLCLTSRVMIADKPVLLVKPKTFMNSSGNVMPFLKKKGIGCENILVVHDEMEKPFGKVHVRSGGSHRGHNGVRSIMQMCGDAFLRVRCGIGRPDNKEEVPDYVIDVFQQTAQEMADFISNAVDVIVDLF